MNSKKNKGYEQHEKNMLKLWRRPMVSALLGVIATLAAVLLPYDDMTLYYDITAGVLYAVAAVLCVTSLCRSLEYDRLRTELLRKNVRSLDNPAVDRLVNLFYHTNSRRFVLAMALSMIRYGLGTEDTYALLKETHDFRKKRLAVPTIFSADWWKAHFTPVHLS